MRNIKEQGKRKKNWRESFHFLLPNFAFGSEMSGQPNEGCNFQTIFGSKVLNWTKTWTEMKTDEKRKENLWHPAVAGAIKFVCLLIQTCFYEFLYLQELYEHKLYFPKEFKRKYLLQNVSYRTCSCTRVIQEFIRLQMFWYNWRMYKTEGFRFAQM